MADNKVTHGAEREATQSIMELSELTGLPFEFLIKIIWEAVSNQQAGKSEEECRQIMGDKIDRYKAEYRTPATTR